MSAFEWDDSENLKTLKPDQIRSRISELRGFIGLAEKNIQNAKSPEQAEALKQQLGPLMAEYQRLMSEAERRGIFKPQNTASPEELEDIQKQVRTRKSKDEMEHEKELSRQQTERRRLATEAKKAALEKQRLANDRLAEEARLDSEAAQQAEERRQREEANRTEEARKRHEADVEANRLKEEERRRTREANAAHKMVETAHTQKVRTDEALRKSNETDKRRRKYQRIDKRNRAIAATTKTVVQGTVGTVVNSGKNAKRLGGKPERGHFDMPSRTRPADDTDYRDYSHAHNIHERAYTRLVSSGGVDTAMFSVGAFAAAAWTSTRVNDIDWAIGGAGVAFILSAAARNEAMARDPALGFLAGNIGYLTLRMLGKIKLFSGQQ